MKKQNTAVFKGVRDYIGRQGELFNTLTGKLASTLEAHNYKPSFCSLIDPNELYTSSLGSSSDIIQKEMFYLKVDELVLRPEGTANLMHALLKTNDYRSYKYPLKNYYLGPMFRYERPQLGRYRQFWQFGVELLDIKADLSQSLEMVQLSFEIIQELNLQDDVVLQINNIGTDADRQKFNEYLKSEFESNMNLMSVLSIDSRTRLTKNPLRILDSKDQRDQEVLSKLKSLLEFVSPESRKEFDLIQQTLTDLNIPYKVNPRLVRGLDYYNDLCFEYIVKESAHKAQNAIIAGGRYDKLYKKMPMKVGFPVYGIGFAVGVDRIIDLFIKQTEQLRLSAKSKTYGLLLLISDEEEFSLMHQTAAKITQLIKAAYPEIKIDKVSASPKGLSKKFDYFLEREIDHCFIVGSAEAKNETVVFRDLQKFSQKTIGFGEIANLLNSH